MVTHNPLLDHKENTPAHWCTIAELMLTLNKPYHLLYAAILNHQGAEWVQREPTGNRRWLINVNSPGYIAFKHTMTAAHDQLDDDLSHLEDEMDEEEMDSDEHISSPFLPQYAFLPALQNHSFPFRPDITLTWPELCQLLVKHGLLIYTNGLAEHSEAPWRWRWPDGASGQHCASKEEAVVAALDVAFTHRALPQPSSQEEPRKEPPPQPKHRFPLF